MTCLDDEVAERVRMLRFHGSRDKKTFELIGTNSRLDAIQAAMLRVFLPQLTGWNAARREAAARYAELGLGEVGRAAGRRARPRLPHVRRSTSRRGRDRGGARARRASRARRTTRPRSTSSLRSRYLGVPEGALPETERAAAENLALPMWGGIAAEQQERVVETVRAALGVPA